MLDYTIHNAAKNQENLVLIHGFGGSSNIFYKQFDAYKEHFNVITINLPGHGHSPDILSYSKEFSIKLVTREVLRTLNALGIWRAHFVGVSLGSIIIHQLLQENPDRVKSVVLVGAVTRFNFSSKALLLLGKLIKGFTPHLWIYSFFAQIMMPKENHRKSREIFIKEAIKMKKSDFLGWYDIFWSIEESYQDVKSNAPHVPKLYVSGREDHLFLGPLIKDIENDHQANLVVLEKCGHVCNIESPKEFNEISVGFLLEQQEQQSQAN